MHPSRLLVYRILFALLLLAGFGLKAQDLQLSPLQWAEPSRAPDVMPELKSAPKLELPPQLGDAREYGYAVAELVLDATGRRVGTQRGATSPTLASLFDRVLEQLKFSPGRRGGKAVNTRIVLSLILNPATAAAGNPEAVPRLLEVTALFPTRLTGGSTRGATVDRVIPAELTVDENGEVADILGAARDRESLIRRATRNWRFAPARRAGQPVSASAKVPVVVVSPPSRSAGKASTPRPVFQARPAYPFALRASGVNGEVVVDFVVDIEGRVKNPVALRSSLPAFEDAAVEAVRKWRFEPSRVGDCPVDSHMQVPIVFVSNRDDGPSSSGLTFKPGDLSKLPEHLRYDKAPQITGLVKTVYPYEALRAGREGHAIVRYVVAKNGKVAEATVQEASDPEFGNSLRAAVEQFTHKPAQKGGEPCLAMLAFRQDFRRDERYQLVSDLDMAMLSQESRKPQAILKANQIDKPLTLMSQRPLAFPISEVGRTTTGTAMIEVIVDDEGRVRLPRIVSATSDAFGHAALNGVAAWRFEPPTRGGRAVAVRVRIPVNFTLKPPP